MERSLFGGLAAPVASHLLSWNHIKQNIQNARWTSLHVQNKVKNIQLPILCFISLGEWERGQKITHLNPDTTPQFTAKNWTQIASASLKELQNPSLKGMETARRDVWMTSAKTPEGAQVASFASSAGQNGAKYRGLLLQAEVLFRPQWRQGYRGQHASINCWEQRRSQGTRRVVV